MGETHKHRNSRVSMKSGLEDRNNLFDSHSHGARPDSVSMKSGLEDRNNPLNPAPSATAKRYVSMKSGLEDRNNRRHASKPALVGLVSMKSGLEDRNNCPRPRPMRWTCTGLNEVRPGRPEQSRTSATSPTR